MLPTRAATGAPPGEMPEVAAPDGKWMQVVAAHVAVAAFGAPDDHLSLVPDTRPAQHPCAARQEVVAGAAVLDAKSLPPLQPAGSQAARLRSALRARV